MSDRINRAVSCLVVLATIGLAACSRTPAGTRGYILISIDTLRADHLGCYGHRRDTSPFIDSLAARGALFENAYAQLPGTLPSHMSMFTGLYPGEHGVYPPNGVLSRRIKTLPEVLSAHGFRTAGHTEGGYVHGAFGFARGFEEFSDESWKVENDVERTLTRGIDFLARLGKRERFFLFLHTYAVHDPYPDVRSRNIRHFPMEAYGKPFWPGEPPAESVEPTGPRLAALNRRGVIPGERVLEYYRAVYDAQIRYLDDLLRGFFYQLEILDLADDVTVVLTSDHGEEFAEHGKLLHEQVYRETLHVPLIAVGPGIAARRIGELVQSIDIAPTLYDLAGIESPPRVSGQSLAPLLAGQRVEGPREAFAEGLVKHERTLLQQNGDGLHQLVWWPGRLEQQGHWMSRELTFDTFSEEIVARMGSFHQPRWLEVLVDGEPLIDLGPELPMDAGGFWASEAVAFDSPGDPLRLTLQSFHRPRRIEFLVGHDKVTAIPRVVSPLEDRVAEDGPAPGVPGEAMIGTDPVVVELVLPRADRNKVVLRADGCDVPAELGQSDDPRCLAFQILEGRDIARVRAVTNRVLVPTEALDLHLDLPRDGKKRVTLRAVSCGVPAELGINDDPRCLSFQVWLPELWQIELFDSARDPRQAAELSAEKSALSRSMLRALYRYQLEPAAEAQSRELEPELEERLRALGYLP